MKIFFLSCICATIFLIYCTLSSMILLQKKIVSLKTFLKALVPFLIIYYAQLCFMESIYSMFFSGICAFILIKDIFEENIFMSMFISLVIHTIKILAKIVVLTILDNSSLLLINTYKTLDMNAVIVNLVTLCCGIIIIFLLAHPFRKIVKYVTSLKKRKIILLVSVYLNFVIILIYQPLPDFWSMDTMTAFIMIIMVINLGIFNLSNEMKMESLNQYYKDMFDYSRANGELLTHYKMQVHENKNRLIMIKGMLDGPKKETKKYIEGLLKEINNNKSNANYWLSELRFIPLPGVRNFINYKLIKLTEHGAELEVFISSELDKIDISDFSEEEYNQLSTILGVVLDNMIDSVENIKEKLISINMYIENNAVHAEFVNSFSNDVDLSRINEVGYTTKGEQHGVGLSLVAKITKSNKRFECTPEIIDNFFIQHLIIKLYEKGNIQKTTKK